MTSKRERELARAKQERQLQRRTERQARERTIKLAVLVGFIAVVVVGVPVAKNIGKQASPSSLASTTPSLAPSTLGICHEVGPMRPDNMHFTKVPANAVGGSALTLQTNCGDIKIALQSRSTAPKTTAAMSFLARSGFFNQTQCHRLTTQGIYVLQCGDPTATGSGGPGFSFADENLPTATGGSAVYQRGTVAMANSGPNTNGSQFFLVYKDSPLPPNYSIWGQISSGLDILDQVAGAGVLGGGADGIPNQRVVISKAIVTP